MIMKATPKKHNSEDWAANDLLSLAPCGKKSPSSLPLQYRSCKTSTLYRASRFYSLPWHKLWTFRRRRRRGRLALSPLPLHRFCYHSGV